MTIGNAGTGHVTVASTGRLTLANVGSSYPFSTIGSAVGSSGTLVVTDTSILDARTESLAIGSAGDGTLVVANLAYAAIGNSGNGGIVLGQQATGTGTLFVQTGGSVAAGMADIGSVNGASGTGTINGSGSSLGIVGLAEIGDGGSGTVVVKDGATLSVGQGITIGDATSAFGSLTLTDAGTLLDDSTGAMVVANGGTGVVTVTAGAIVSVGTGTGAQLTVGENAGSKGTLIISAGTTVAAGSTVAAAGSLYTEHATLGGVATATGSIAVTGTGALWQNDGFLLAGDFGAGTLAVSSGGSVSVGANATFAEVAHSAGALTVAGAGSRFSAELALRLGAGKAAIAVTNGGVITAEALTIGAGDTVAIDSSSSMVIGPIVGTVTGGLYIEPNAVASGAGTITAAIADNGTIIATGGTLQITGAITGSGTLDDSATLQLDGAVDSNLALVFDPGTLIVGSPLAMNAAISNFATADTIEFVGTYGTVTKDFPSNTLEVFGNGSLVGTFNLGPGYDATNVHVADKSGLVSITADVPCFAAGTSLATPRGEVAVDGLAAGDELLTLSGTVQRVTWIGRRRIDLTRHPEPSRAQPIRIRPDTFADGVPRRELRLSPDHAVLRDGLLIPIRLLVNGASVLRDTGCRTVTYYHVELATHDVLLADNLPAESYLDTGNRAMFENSGQPLLLHPDLTNDQARREAESCAPFAADADRVEPVWQFLAARAARLGLALPEAPQTTDDPALHIVARRRQIPPVTRAEGRYVFLLPRDANTARLVSRWFILCDQRPWVEDRRRLGVMVRRLTLHIGDEVAPVALDDPSLCSGWWQPEHAGGGLWRWTDGDATLPLPGGKNGPVLLEVELGSKFAYELTGTAAASVCHRAA